MLQFPKTLGPSEWRSHHDAMDSWCLKGMTPEVGDEVVDRQALLGTATHGGRSSGPTTGGWTL